MNGLSFLSDCGEHVFFMMDWILRHLRSGTDLKTPPSLSQSLGSSAPSIFPFLRDVWFMSLFPHPFLFIFFRTSDTRRQAWAPLNSYTFWDWDRLDKAE